MPQYGVLRGLQASSSGSITNWDHPRCPESKQSPKFFNTILCLPESTQQNA